MATPRKKRKSRKSFWDKPRDWDEVLVTTPRREVTRREIRDYYLEHEDEIFPYLKDQTVMVLFAPSRDYFLYKRHTPSGELIKIQKRKGIDDPSSYEYWVQRRVIEFHRVIGARTHYIWVDIDPHARDHDPKVIRAMERAVPRVVDVMRRAFPNATIEIWHSGKRGIHVEGYLSKAVSTDHARKLLRKGLDAEFLRDPRFTTGLARPGQVRLDVTTLKRTGSIRAPLSFSVAGRPKVPYGTQKPGLVARFLARLKDLTKVANPGALPPGFEGFEDVDETARVDPLRDAIASVGPEPTLVDPSRVLKQTAMLTPSTPVYYWQREGIWMIQVQGDAAQALKKGSAARRALIGRRNLTPADPSMHGKPLLVVYDDGYLRIEQKGAVRNPSAGGDELGEKVEEFRRLLARKMGNERYSVSAHVVPATEKVEPFYAVVVELDIAGPRSIDRCEKVIMEAFRQSGLGQYLEFDGVGQGSGMCTTGRARSYHFYERPNRSSNPAEVDTVVRHVDMLGPEHRYAILAGDLETNEVYGHMDVSVLEGEAFIQWVEVKPEHRRKGVATAIYDRLEKWAKAEGLKVVGGIQTPEGSAFRTARLKRRLLR